MDLSEFYRKPKVPVGKVQKNSQDLVREFSQNVFRRQLQDTKYHESMPPVRNNEPLSKRNNSGPSQLKRNTPDALLVKDLGADEEWDCPFDTAFSNLFKKVKHN